MKDKALFVVSSLFGGGAEQATIQLATELSGRMEVDVVTLYSASDYPIPQGVNYYCLNLDRSKRPPMRQLAIVRACKRFDEFTAAREQSGKYNLITAHLMGAYILLRFSRLSRRCLYVIHADPANAFGGQKLPQCLYTRLLLGKRKIVAVSEGVRSRLVDGFGLDDSDCFVIANPVAPRAFSSRDIQPIATSRPYILFLGRLEGVKRPERALRAFLQGGFYDSYDLVFVGKGSLENALRIEADESGHGEAVRFMGFLKDPFPWICSSSAMLLTSDSEALPTVLIEGLIAGAHVVSSDCDFGPREIMTGDLASFLVSPSDIDGYVTALRRAISDYPVISEDFKKRYRGDSVASRYLDLYKAQIK